MWLAARMYRSTACAAAETPKYLQQIKQDIDAEYEYIRKLQDRASAWPYHWQQFAAKRITKTAFQKEMFWENEFRNNFKS